MTPRQLVTILLTAMLFLGGCRKKPGPGRPAPNVAASTRTPLHQAARMGAIDVARSLLAEGADANAKDKEGNTPLHHALWEGHVEIAAMLIEHGAEVNARGRSGQTPLHVAASKGHRELAVALVDKGADVNAKDENGTTPLHDAASGALPRLLRC